MSDLVIFGTGQIAELAYYYFCTDSDYTIVAFTADSEYIKDPVFCGLPVIPCEEIAAKCPPESHSLFIALGYSKINSIRREKYSAAKELGYTLANYVSSRATVLNEGSIGQNCFILEDNTIQPFAILGNNVTLWSGNHIGHHSVVGNHSFVSSHVVISGGVVIGEQCFIGVNATLRDHIKIGDRCIVGAGAILLADADPEGVYLGSVAERSQVPSTRLRII